MTTHTPNLAKKTLTAQKLSNSPSELKLDSKENTEALKANTYSIANQEVLSKANFDVICAYCLSTNIPVINARECGHNNFSITYFQVPDNETLYVCGNCHYMLRKIDAFLVQVNARFNLLKTENRKALANNKFNLQRTPVSILSFDVKSEYDQETVVAQFEEDTKEFNIKVETENESDDETYSEAQSHTQNCIETQTLQAETHFAFTPITVTPNYIDAHKSHIIHATPAIFSILKGENDTKTHTNPTSSLQNCTKIHINPTSSPQNCKETHTNPTSSPQNCTKTHTNPSLSPKNCTEKHTSPTSATQNCTETDRKRTVSNILKGKQQNNKYNGKIKTLKLTEHELKQERHRLENDEAYLKLHYKCRSCIKGFDHEDTLKIHNEKHHPEFSVTIYTCTICKCVLADKPRYDAHCRAHYKRYECVVCNKRSGDLPTLAYHYNTVHCNAEGALLSPIPLQYDCDECSYTTDCNRRYRYHKQKHKARTVCEFCNKEFVGQSAYRRHVICVHVERAASQRPAVHSCAVCARSYSCKSSLTSHVRQAHSAQRLYCHSCDSTFSCETNYRIHLNTSANHVHLKFTCNDCGKVFKRKFSLRQHIEWEHLKNYNHKCQYCNKAYQSASGLRSHVQTTHLNVKPARNHTCHYCGKRFTNTQRLTSHIRTHTGERPLRCDACDARFAHSGALHTHRRRVHKLQKGNH